MHLSEEGNVPAVEIIDVDKFHGTKMTPELRALADDLASTVEEDTFGALNNDQVIDLTTEVILDVNSEALITEEMEDNYIGPEANAKFLSITPLDELVIDDQPVELGEQIDIIPPFNSASGKNGIYHVTDVTTIEGEVVQPGDPILLQGFSEPDPEPVTYDCPAGCGCKYPSEIQATLCATFCPDTLKLSQEHTKTIVNNHKALLTKFSEELVYIIHDLGIAPDMIPFQIFVRSEIYLLLNFKKLEGIENPETRDKAMVFFYNYLRPIIDSGFSSYHIRQLDLEDVPVLQEIFDILIGGQNFSQAQYIESMIEAISDGMPTMDSLIKVSHESFNQWVLLRGKTFLWQSQITGFGGSMQETIDYFKDNFNRVQQEVIKADL